MSDLFFRNNHLLALSIIVLLVGGLVAVNGLPRLEDPRITNRNPILITAYPGAPADRVEALVTKPLETVLRELSEVKKLETTSRPGVSVIAIELLDRIGSDENELVFSRIRDKIGDAARRLPPGVQPPVFDDELGATTFTVIVALSPAEGYPMKLNMVARLGRVLEDRLRDLPGTDLVRQYGDSQEELRVTLDQKAMKRLGLSATEVAQAIQLADTKLPAGAFRGSDRNYTMEIEGDLDSVVRISNIPLRTTSNGRVVRVGDVATVSHELQDPPNEIAISNGKRATYVGARVEPERRVDLWAVKAIERIDVFREEHPGLQVDLIFDQTKYTEERLSGLVGNLLMGAGVVTIAIFFLMGWRASLLIALAIPLTASAVLFSFSILEIPLHQMSIFGMIIALGLLIDNAIVVVDEVRKGLEEGHRAIDAIREAISHLFVPLLGSTLTTVLSFMPILLLPGNVGDFIGTISVSVILALIFSFLLSMTILPALAGHFLKIDKEKKSFLQRGLPAGMFGRGFKAFARWCFHRPIAGILIAMLPPIIGFAVAPQLRQQFFPPADRDQISIEVWTRGDTSINRTAEISAEIEHMIHQATGVKEVHWLVGASMPSVYYNLVMNKDNTPSYAQGVIFVDSTERVKAVIEELQPKLDKAFPETMTVLSMLGQGPPIESPIQLLVEGPSADQLRLIGEEVRQVLAETPGVIHTRASMSGGLPKLLARVNEEEAKRAGLSLAAVGSQLQANMEGIQGGIVVEGTELLPIRVRYGDDERGNMTEIANMGLISPSAGSLPLQSLGSLDLIPEQSAISRRDGERSNYIEGYIHHSALPIVVTENFLQRLEAKGYQMPPGYRLVISGDAEKQAEAVSQLMLYLPVLLTLMVTTIVLSFRSVVCAAIIGMIGGLAVGLATLSIYISGYPFGFNPMLGTAGLIGVALNDSIVVLAALRANPDARAGKVDAVLQEVLGCGRHVMATTLTTIGGFLPLLLLTGGDFWPPLAVVMAGGVSGATFLAVLFVPAAYLQALRFFPFVGRERSEQAQLSLNTATEVPA